MRRNRILPALMLATMVAAAAPAAAQPAAPPQQRFSIIEENDSLPFNSDKHYTQGLRFSYLAPPIAEDSFWTAPFDAAGWVLPWIDTAGATRTRRYAILLGQSIFTPKETDLSPPDPADRPYAGWLYGGISLLQETDHRILDHVELQLGLVGPGAAGRSAQNDWHQFIGKSKSKGWGSQIQNEPGGLIEVERKWRVGVLGDGALGVDVVPELGAVAGNVFTYGKTGAMLRFGTHLGADYGPARITPALSGTDYVDEAALPQSFGIYGFIGAEGRAVGRNLFLDGNSFRESRDVDKKALVGDLQAGISMFWSNAARLDLVAMTRSPEFEGQGAPDVLGVVGLSFFW